MPVRSATRRCRWSPKGIDGMITVCGRMEGSRPRIPARKAPSNASKSRCGTTLIRWSAGGSVSLFGRFFKAKEGRGAGRAVLMIGRPSNNKAHEGHKRVFVSARQASGEFLGGCCQMRVTFQPWRRSWRFTRLTLLPPTSSALRGAPRRSLSEPPLRFRAVAGHVGLAFATPEGAVGFRASVAHGAVVPIASAVRRQKVRARWIEIIGLTLLALASLPAEVFWTNLSSLD